MVSFCCDACQNVFTKPKVERHLQSCNSGSVSCNSGSVSCIDCGVVFDLQTVRGHTSCITEAEKFGPKGGDACTQSFCGICQLRLNGAVHAVQHYDSKKHRAAVKRRERPRGDGGGKGDELVHAALVHDRGQVANNAANKVKVRGLTRVMKKVLLNARKQRLKKTKLLSRVLEALGNKAPDNLESLVDEKIAKSKRFLVRKHRVMLSLSTEK